MILIELRDNATSNHITTKIVDNNFPLSQLKQTVREIREEFDPTGTNYAIIKQLDNRGNFMENIIHLYETL